MEGVLVLDKPPGMTSHDVVDELRRRTSRRRIGHAGSLDPNATGVLLLLFERATKVSRWLMGLDKQYVFTIQLGIETTTHDRWGQIIRSSDLDNLDERLIGQAVMSFRGRYQQIAPAVSALKYRGRPLYKIAREGGQVPIKTRLVRIRSIEILDVCLPMVTLKVDCSSGTYVRALARDIGRQLGCGATVFCLRRTRIGPFDVEMATSLDDLVSRKVDLSKIMLSIDRALGYMPRVTVRQGRERAIRMGKPPEIDDLVNPDEIPEEGDFCLVDSEGNLIGIGHNQAKGTKRMRLDRIL
ncbi:MAG TPA: tRNA pseudouridine(55) synthase TruB [Firmicutes bacterium]|nr:tRNA pseudouridine(55) synthase TruB [Bacillota bacterium]